MSVRDTGTCLSLRKVTPFGALGILGVVKSQLHNQQSASGLPEAGLQAEAHAPTEAFRGRLADLRLKRIPKRNPKK